VAEAAIDVVRVRRARTTLMERLFQDCHDPNPVAPAQPISPQPAGSRIATGDGILTSHNEGHQELGPMEAAQIRQACEADMEGRRVRHRCAEAVQLAKQRVSAWDLLGKLDRYERRALSRRNTAMKAFDAARAAYKATLSSAST
jgi:hypothetical protein